MHRFDIENVRNSPRAYYPTIIRLSRSRSRFFHIRQPSQFPKLPNREASCENETNVMIHPTNQQKHLISQYMHNDDHSAVTTTTCFLKNERMSVKNNKNNLSGEEKAQLKAVQTVLRDGVGHMRLPFAFKLHLLLEDMEKTGRDDIISWVEDGKAFKIHKPTVFETKIQHRYFQQSKIASFIRQVRIISLYRRRSYVLSFHIQS